MMHKNTLSQTLEKLKAKGYKHDFNLLENKIESKALNMHYTSDKFFIHNIFKIEAKSNPNGKSIIYAIETENGIKGTLVDNYGTYGGFLSEEMVKKFKYKGT
jgi:hypothetical protein